MRPGIIAGLHNISAFLEGRNQMTEKELKVKLKRFPHVHNQHRAELTERLTVLMKEKDTLTDGIKAYRIDGAPKSKQRSDPTYQTVVNLEKKFAKGVQEIVDEIKAVDDEMLMIQKALDWLRLQGGQYYSVICQRSINARGWVNVSTRMGYCDTWVKRLHNRALAMMLGWMNR